MSTARRGTRRETVAANRAARPRLALWLLLPVLVLATLAAYQPAWDGGLLWDDDAHVTRVDLRSLDGLRRIWFEVGATQQYYPLVHTAFWIQHRLWGDRPLGYHVVNILLHASSAFLLAVILRKLAVPWPWLAALVFALHPVHVESVAWMTELKNTLSGFLCLAAALVYLTFDERRRARTYVGALALFTLALLSKTVTAMLPALLLVVLWWRRGKLEWMRDIRPLVPFGLLAAAFGALTVWAERTLIGARGAEFDLGVFERMQVAGRALWFYAGTLVWPADLVFIYPRWTIDASDWRLYLYPVGAAAALAALWMWRGRSRGPLAAALFFAIGLFPALGFFNVYPFRFSFVADHFQYLASIGLIVAVTSALATRLERPASTRRWIPAAVAVILIGPLAAATAQQARDYAGAETLYRATIRRNPSAWLAHNNLAVLLLPHGVDEAMGHLEIALRLNPGYAEAHNNRGLALQLLERYAEAEREHAKALQLEPAFADAQNNLGTALVKLGRPEEAVGAYREALRLRPDFFQAHANLGDALMALNRPGEAVAEYREALRVNPGLATVHFNLAAGLVAAGRSDEAMAHYQETLRLEPSSADAYLGVGRLLEQAGRQAEALDAYAAAARLEPGSAPLQINLGHAFYRRGDWQRAAAHFEAAIALAPGSAEAHNNLGACLERLGRIDEALAQYRETARLAPESADARANVRRASALLKSGSGHK